MGVTGTSVLAVLPCFNIVDGFCIDSMHAVFEGVVSDLLSRVLRDDMTAKVIATLDRRLSSVQVPAEIARTTRPVADFRSSKWRVSELHTFLFLAPVLLVGLLPERKLKLFEQLCVSVYYLHSSFVSPAVLASCDKLIRNCCNAVHQIYGDAACTYNMHVLQHLCLKVTQCGPLHTHSCDFFEREFAKMLKVNHGSRGAANQIFRYLNLRPFALFHWSSQSISDASLRALCDRLLSSHWSLSSMYVNANTVLLGNSELVQLPFAISSYLKLETREMAKSFPKCVFSGHLYRTVGSYPSEARRNDSYIFYCNQFYIVVDIILFRSKVYLLCNATDSEVIPIASLCNIDYPLHRIRTSTRLRCFAVDRIYSKCYCYYDGMETYALPLPNMDFRT